MPAVKQFEVGKTYTTASMADHTIVFRFEIVRRTAKRLVIREAGKTYTRGIYVYHGVEWCKPHGTFSMCPFIHADRIGDAG